MNIPRRRTTKRKSKNTLRMVLDNNNTNNNENSIPFYIKFGEIKREGKGSDRRRSNQIICLNAFLILLLFILFFSFFVHVFLFLINKQIILL